MVTAPISRSTELGLQVYLTGGQGDNALSSIICPFLLLLPDSHYPQVMEPFAEYRNHLFSLGKNQVVILASGRCYVRLNRKPKDERIKKQVK